MTKKVSKHRKTNFTKYVFLMCEKNGFRVRGRLVRPSEQGLEILGEIVMCRPCGKPVVWGSHQNLIQSTKHVAKLGTWVEEKKREQLMLTQHTQ